RCVLFCFFPLTSPLFRFDVPSCLFGSIAPLRSPGLKCLEVFGRVNFLLICLALALWLAGADVQMAVPRRVAWQPRHMGRFCACNSWLFSPPYAGPGCRCCHCFQGK
ncbi:unnamed protein product, partial [Phaeothamnion confervicola]